MNFLDKFKAWFYGISIPVPKSIVPEPEPTPPPIICGKEDMFADPDHFEDCSEHNSLLVDSKEGAPE